MKNSKLRNFLVTLNLKLNAITDNTFFLFIHSDCQISYLKYFLKS